MSPSEAKSQGIDSGVTRARRIASGNLSKHDVKRMSAFNRHRKNNRPDKKMPDGGPTAGTIAWKLWGGTSGVNWARNKSKSLGAENVAFAHDEHDEIDDMIEELDKLTSFCITFLHDGAYGGEPQEMIEDKARGIREQKVLYLEGSIELKFVYDEEGKNIAIRAKYTNDPQSPVIYLPATEMVARKPDELPEH